MFGKKKAATSSSAAKLVENEEPVHVFDQTNGVLKRFEEYHGSAGAKPVTDYENPQNVVTTGVAGNIIGAAGGL